MKAKYGDGGMTAIKGNPGFFHFTMPLPKDHPSGKPRSPKFRCVSKAEGRRAFLKWDADFIEQAKSASAPRIITVGAYVRNHYEAVKNNYAATTRALHESIMSVHIYPDTELCALDIRALSSAHLQAYLKRVNGSEPTKNKIYKHLHAYFQAAVEEGVLEKNPIKLAKAKKPRASKSDIVAIPPEHEDILRQTKDPRWRPIVLFALDTGVRMSELLGLKWDKVDFDRREVHIHRTLDTVKGNTVLKEATKTDSSRRTIPVGKYTLDALKGLREPAKGQSGYVFGDEGKPVTRYAFDKRWKKFVKELGLPQYTFHQCRHTCATRLLRGGAYLTAVSKRLGHSRPSITLDTYSDALPSDQGPLTDAFDQDMSRFVSQ